MNKQQLLMDILLEAETFNAHLKRLRREHALHILDVDLLKDKIKLIYERVMDLESFVENKDTYVISATKKAEANESKEPEFVESVEPVKDEKIDEPDVAEDIKTIEKEPEVEKEEEKEVVEEKEPVFETQEVQDENIANTPPKQNKEEETVIKTTLDLFSDITQETLSDKISQDDEPTVVDRLQKSQIGDLREAIGINEKFQFINELFNGDMTRYNKAVDELNSFSSLDEAKTYLFELSVEYQWNDDLPALIRLKELLERKFS